MNKKVISSVLAGAMALSTMGVVASAADGTGNTDEGNVALTAKASLMEATINADLPQEIETFINPYGASVEVTAGTGIVDAIKYSDGLISPTYSITNQSEGQGIKVTATATIKGSSTVTVNTKLLDDVKLQKATEKQVFAFLNTTTDATADDAPIFASTKYVGNNQQVVFTEDGSKVTGIMTIGKKPSAGADKTCMGYFYIGGQCTPNPETAWDSKDTVDVSLILDLSPTMGDPADLSLSGIELVAGTAYKEFDAAKTTYEIAASGSKTKASAIKVTATDTTAKVYVKINGEFIGADVTAAVGVNAVTGVGTAAATVEPYCSAAAVAGPPAVPATFDDYKVGDKIEFIVVNATTNESATYTFNFT